jgi:signal transduction histidine kinase
VPGDGRRLEQVFINLLLNAGKAMQGNGSITITAAATSSTQGGPETEITVEDSGPGIPEKDLPRIFDPFFTTGDGTGLGLSISYGILRAHGGSIVAENRAEGGARFTLRLPAAALAPPASATPPVSRKPEEPRNAATAHSPSARKIET